MEIVKLDVHSLDIQTRFAILEMERERKVTGANWGAYWADLGKTDCIGLYEDQKLSGIVSVNPNCPYFGGSILIRKLMYRWDCDQPKVIAAMIHQVAAEYDSEYICMEINKRHEINQMLYLELGFEESVMASAISAENVVLICSRDKMLVR